MSTSSSREVDEMRSNVKGVAWALIAVGLFSLIYVSGKLTGGATPALQIIWLRYVGGFATVAPLVFLRGGTWRAIATRQPHVHFLRGPC